MLEEVQRHKTALRRSSLSRPLRLAVEDGVVSPDRSLLDYGCGRGDDLRSLKRQGFDCVGWDPAHRPDGEKRSSDVVNIGYVVNVIENVRERVDALRSAWQLTKKVMVVSAQLVGDA